MGAKILCLASWRKGRASGARYIFADVCPRWACSASFSSRLHFNSASTSPYSRTQAASLLSCLRSAFPLAVICLTSSHRWASPASCMTTFAAFLSADDFNLVKTDCSLIERGLLEVIANSPWTYRLWIERRVVGVFGRKVIRSWGVWRGIGHRGKGSLVGRLGQAKGVEYDVRVVRTNSRSSKARLNVLFCEGFLMCSYK